MNRFLRLCGVWLAALALGLAGCGADDHAGGAPDEMTTEHGSGGSVDAKALEGLSAADRARAKAQATCPVSDEPLGSMGTPIKVTHGDKTVFLCCKGCEKKFHRDAEAYLKKVEQGTK